MSVYSAKNANNFPTFQLIPNYVRYMLHDLFQFFFLHTSFTRACLYIYSLRSYLILISLYSFYAFHEFSFHSFPLRLVLRFSATILFPPMVCRALVVFPTLTLPASSSTHHS